MLGCLLFQPSLQALLCQGHFLLWPLPGRGPELVFTEAAIAHNGARAVRMGVTAPTRSQGRGPRGKDQDLKSLLLLFFHCTHGYPHIHTCTCVRAPVYDRTCTPMHVCTAHACTHTCIPVHTPPHKGQDTLTHTHTPTETPYLPTNTSLHARLTRI